MLKGFARTEGASFPAIQTFFVSAVSQKQRPPYRHLILSFAGVPSLNIAESGRLPLTALITYDILCHDVKTFLESLRIG